VKRYVAVLVLSLPSFWLAAGEAGPAPRQRRQVVMVLHDGTRLVGRVAGVENGVYTVALDAAGKTVRRVTAADIASLSFVPAGARPAKPAVRPKAPETGDAGGGRFGIEGMRQRLLADPRIMAMIGRLAEDEEVQKVLADEDIRRHVENGEYLKLMANEKLRSLLDNQSMKNVVEQVLKQEAE
jgi:hypothetical protein